MVRRRVRQDEGGQDGRGPLRWLMTYADMITLLMAFFIMMYSMSILNLNRFKEVAVSIKGGFGDGRFAPIEGESIGVPQRIVKKLQGLVQEDGLRNMVKLRVDDRGLIISLNTDKVLFDKGQADLTREARHVLDDLAVELDQIPNDIQIEGHTCDLPVISDKYPSNWELSTARATNVIRYLIEQGKIPSARLSASGYADSKPLVPNTCEKNRSINRRVDIVILKNEY
ncbi:MAG: OmpA family protein [Armatimonadota bacterium]